MESYGSRRFCSKDQLTTELVFGWILRLVIDLDWLRATGAWNFEVVGGADVLVLLLEGLRMLANGPIVSLNAGDPL